MNFYKAGKKERVFDDGVITINPNRARLGEDLEGFSKQEPKQKSQAINLAFSLKKH